MGCCISTKNFQNSEQKPIPLSPNHLRRNAPATPPLEEETVIEVVPSETTAPRPPDSPSLLELDKPIDLQESAAEENSEVSGFVSVGASESLSTTTATTTILMREKEDGDEVEKEVMSQKAEKPRVQAKVLTKRTYPGDVVGGKESRKRAPAKKTVPSPERRSNFVGPLRGNVIPAGSRAVPGVGGGRRSMSPATRNVGGGGTPNAGNGSSSRGVRSSRTSVNTGTPQAVTVKKGGSPGVPNGGVFPSVSESLENPLVSLECFIFL
ncbi:hypothetical protein Nepgr_000448 [Nepenthes gracilis]|uniref:Uncharacterized protein n=1 Tax=Nepenthes gracilis TaxID=150966 RepID=A0AAD3RW86_NEPGR|nr:hypothetical protein Nepgr_000448 [Nepenthes gracilis]